MTIVFTFYRIVCKSNPEAVASFEQALFPTFQGILQQDIQGSFAFTQTLHIHPNFKSNTFFFIFQNSSRTSSKFWLCFWSYKWHQMCLNHTWHCSLVC